MTDLGQLFADLLRVETRLFNTVDARLRVELEVTAGQHHLLEFVAGRPGCRVGEIVRALAISVGAASKTVDRLVARGWCVRTADPADGRSSMLEVTAAGQRLLTAAEPLIQAELERLVASQLSESAIRSTSRSLRVLADQLDTRSVGVPGVREAAMGD